MKNTVIQNDIEIIQRVGLFDSDWYVEQYPDVRLSGLDPLEHYVRVGSKIARNPGPEFDARRYTSAYPELLGSGLNPLVHFALNGKPGEFYGKEPAGSAETNVVVMRKRTDVKGFLDQVTATGLVGWAIDPKRPNHPVALSVYVDGVHLMDVTTSTKRNDVISKGMAGECAGFSLAWPAGLLPKGTSIDIKVKSTEVSLSRSPKVIAEDVNGAARHESRYLEAYRDGQIRPVTVIVPVYNAYDAVRECLDSLKEYTHDAEVLVINDSSPDERIAGLLEGYRAQGLFKIHHNETNLGYTRTVNKAISLCAGRDVVLLNSDTVVTERWLENMRYCAYAKARVATVTALSDNAGAFSAPEFAVYNPVPDEMTPSEFARTVTTAGEGRLIEVPTGNGFCLYIRRALIDEIGVFDEEKFPRGYGEENEFCMRALRAGWANLVTDKVYVFHKRSQSFQGEKVALMEAGAKAINEEFPEYKLLTQRFRDVEFSHVRHRIRHALQNQAVVPNPRILYVISTQTGGTPQTNLDLMRSMQGKFDCLLLRCDAQTLTLSALRNDAMEVVEAHQLSRAIEPITHRSAEYDRIVADMMYRHSISLLHIRHIAWHSMGLAEAAQSMSIPVVYSLHDFYSVCPSLNLLDESVKYCGATCTSGEGTCQIGLWPTTSFPPLKNQFVFQWQKMFSQFLNSCDALVTTAVSAAAVITKTFPQAKEKLNVIPHGRDFPSFQMSCAWPAPSRKIRVLVPGNIGIAKGANVLAEVARLDTEGLFEFHFLGNIAPILKGVGIHHGNYDRGSFGAKVAEINPTFGVVFSLCPETYCHTLTEMWACSLPVIGFDIGAVGDRLAANGAGWLISPDASPEHILSEMTRLVSTSAEFEAKLEATKNWQASEGIWNDTAMMSSDYRNIYYRLLKPGQEERIKKVGLLLKPGTRVSKSLDTAISLSEAGEACEFRMLDTKWAAAGGATRLDILILEYNVAEEKLSCIASDAANAGVTVIWRSDPSDEWKVQ